MLRHALFPCCCIWPCWLRRLPVPGGAGTHQPVLIDFTSENVNENCQELDALRSGGAPATPLPQSPRQQTGKPRAAAVASTLREASAPPTAVEQSAEAVPVAAAPSEVPPPQVAAVTHNAPPVSTGSRGSGIAGSGSGASAGGGDAASGHGGRGTSEETLRQRYLKRHFAYIRDRVASNMRYPAWRSGWAGVEIWQLSLWSLWTVRLRGSGW